MENIVQNAIDISIKFFCIRPRYDTVSHARRQYDLPMKFKLKPAGITAADFEMPIKRDDGNSLPDLQHSIY